MGIIILIILGIMIEAYSSNMGSSNNEPHNTEDCDKCSGRDSDNVPLPSEFHDLI